MVWKLGLTVGAGTPSEPEALEGAASVGLGGGLLGFQEFRMVDFLVQHALHILKMALDILHPRQHQE